MNLDNSRYFLHETRLFDTSKIGSPDQKWSKCVWLVSVVLCQNGCSCYQEDKQVLEGCLCNQEGHVAVQ